MLPPRFNDLRESPSEPNPRDVCLTYGQQVVRQKAINLNLHESAVDPNPSQLVISLE